MDEQDKIQLEPHRSTRQSDQDEFTMEEIMSENTELSERRSVLDKELSSTSLAYSEESLKTSQVQSEKYHLTGEATSIEQLMSRSPGTEYIISKIESFVSEKISSMRQNFDEGRQKLKVNEEISTFSFSEDESDSSPRLTFQSQHSQAHSIPLNRDAFEEKTVACKYASYGCKETLVVGSLHEIDHYVNCKYRPLACLLQPTCKEIMPFHGYIPHLGKHFLVPIHSATIETTVVLSPEDLEKTEDQKWTPKWFFAFDHHFFAMIVRKKEGLWSIWVWTLGDTEDAQNFVVSLKIFKGFKSIQEIIPVHSIRVPAEEIESEKMCLYFSDETMSKLTDLKDHLFSDFTIQISLRDNAKTLNSSIREKRLLTTNYSSSLHIQDDESQLGEDGDDAEADHDSQDVI